MEGKVLVERILHSTNSWPQHVYNVVSVHVFSNPIITVRCCRYRISLWQYTCVMSWIGKSKKWHEFLQGPEVLKSFVILVWNVVKNLCKNGCRKAYSSNTQHDGFEIKSMYGCEVVQKLDDFVVNWCQNEGAAAKRKILLNCPGACVKHEFLPQFFIPNPTWWWWLKSLRNVKRADTSLWTSKV